jgi:hypothetical protein
MRKKLAFVLCVAVICGLGVATYFVFFQSGSSAIKAATHPIEQNTKYYISALRNGFYRHSDASLVNLAPQDDSYCVFEENFKIFKIRFTSGSGLDFDFVVTKIKRSNNNKKITATVCHIYKGELITFKLKTTNTKIELFTSVSYKVLVATESQIEPHEMTISRGSTLGIAFNRTTPAYITESGS